MNTLLTCLLSSSSLGSHLITAANFCANGKFAVAGTYDGRCIFYDTEVRGLAMPLYLLSFRCLQHLKYHTQIHVRSRHGKNRGRKISGVEPLPGENKARSLFWGGDVCDPGISSLLFLIDAILLGAGHLK